MLLPAHRRSKRQQAHAARRRHRRRNEPHKSFVTAVNLIHVLLGSCIRQMLQGTAAIARSQGHARDWQRDRSSHLDRAYLPRSSFAAKSKHAAPMYAHACWQLHAKDATQR